MFYSHNDGLTSAVHHMVHTAMYFVCINCMFAQFSMMQEQIDVVRDVL